MSVDVLYLKRKIVNNLALVFAGLAMLVGLLFLGAVLWTLIAHGLPGMTWKTFSQMTPPPGEDGGLLNAIAGSAIITVLGTLLGTPIGILAGTYLAEYGKEGAIASTVRFMNSMLLSMPSVVVGFFIYALVVARMGHFSAWAGALALAMILIPIVTNNTENMLKLVPASLREASAALGATKYQTIVGVTYQASKTGLMTGILLGIARISGESAPLLFTSLNNQFWSLNLGKPMANLPIAIFQFAMSPYDDWQRLAWTGALIITVGVLLLNVFARVMVRKSRSR